MALHRVDVPAVSESLEQMTIIEWHVGPGGHVSEGGDLVSVESEKVDLVIPSPIGGIVVEVHVDLDDEVSPGDPLCVIESGSQP